MAREPLVKKPQLKLNGRRKRWEQETIQRLERANEIAHWRNTSGRFAASWATHGAQKCRGMFKNKHRPTKRDKDKQHNTS